MNIPYAIDCENQERIKADRAKVGIYKGRYLCYGCERHVHVVHKSKYNRVHFKHYPNEALGCRYSKSQDLHSKAKERIAVLFENALNNLGAFPMMLFQTPKGGFFVLPFIVGHLVKREKSIEEIKRRPDVVILDAVGNLVLAIEIKHKHGVDAKKSMDLGRNFWIEVDAQDIMQNEFLLKIRTHGNLPPQLELSWHQNVLF